jgi:hypothetical protein
LTSVTKYILATSQTQLILNFIASPSTPNNFTPAKNDTHTLSGRSNAFIANSNKHSFSFGADNVFEVAFD